MIAWQHIETVLLDMDGTLLDLHYDNYFWNEHLPAHYAGVHGLDLDQTREELLSRFRSRLGELEFYCIEHWSNELGMDLLPLKREVEDRIGFLPGARELLAHLRALQLDTVLLTNAHQAVLDIKQVAVGITDFCDAAYVSHSFGLPKEDPAFWPRFSESHPFDPDKTVFIDDNPAVLAAADQFGIRHCVQPLKPDSQQPVKPASENNHIQVESLVELLPVSSGSAQ